MNFERFFSRPPCKKANRRLAYAKPAAWPRGVRTKKGDEGNDGYRSINVVDSTARKSWGSTSWVRLPEILSPA